jgi:hypothetical protein
MIAQSQVNNWSLPNWDDNGRHVIWRLVRVSDVAST